MYRIFFLFLLFFSLAYSKPSGKKVTLGKVTSSQKGDRLTLVQEGKKAIVEWDSFSIGKKETVTFSQPSKNASILNRVTGKGASKLLGNLKANGKIYLLNKNGIFIGKSGVINAGAFIASTLDLKDEAFQKDKDLKFSGDSNASIVNQGKVLADTDIYFFAKEIENTGTLSSENVGLGAGQILLQEGSCERFFVCPDSEGTILNEGLIEATNIELKAQGGNLYSLAINHTGVIEANSICTEKGRVILKATDGHTSVSGTIKNNGETRILGKEVRVKEAALIDASNTEIAGTVLIGGDYQGKNPDVPNAKSTFVEPGATILANGLETGDGGKVIVWGDDLISFYGEIQAKGGEVSGNGGFVEISSPKSWNASIKNISVKAENGKNGQLLLDPADITIDAVGPTNPAPIVSPYDTAGNVATLLNTDVNTFLTDSGSLTIQTSGAGVSEGVVSVTADVTWANDSVLTIKANKGISISPGATISNTDATTSAAPVIVLNGNTELLSTGQTVGVEIEGIVSTVGRSISITGTGGDTASSNYGVHLDGTAPGEGRVITTSGQIVIVGSSEGPGTDNVGCILDNAASIVTGTGDITITGTGSVLGTSDNHGVELDASTITSSDSGQIQITGTGGGTTTNNRGIFLQNGSIIDSSNADGTLITLNGTGGNGTASNDGIEIDNSFITTTVAEISLTGLARGSAQANHGISSGAVAGMVSSTSGDISLTGTGSQTGTSFNHGIFLSFSIATDDGIINLVGQSTDTDNAAPTHGITTSNCNITSTGTSGSINLTGTGSGIGGDGGISIGTTTIISSQDADIFIKGTGNGTMDSSIGCIIGDTFLGAGASNITTDSGSITIIGNGSAVGDSLNHGVIFNDTSVTTASGQVSVTGTAGGTTTDNYGIHLLSAANIASTAATGTITLTGIGGSGTNDNYGINAEDSTITTVGASLTLSGTGKGSTTDNHGINILNPSIISTTTGALSVTGTGSTTGTNTNHGIFATGNVSTTTGAVTLTGTGNGSGTDNVGIFIGAGGVVDSIAGPAGSLSLVGRGGAGTSGNTGILVQGGGALVTSLDADISLTGTGRGSGANAHGIEIDAGNISSTGIANISLTGTSSFTGTGSGVLLSNAGFVSSTGTGNTTITAIDPNASSGDLVMSTGSTIGGATTGDITLRVDIADLDSAAGGAIITTAGGTVSIIPRTPAISIGLATGSAGTLNLVDNELDALQAAIGQIQIGNVLSNGIVDIQAYAYLSPIKVYGKTISVNGAVSTAVGDVELNVGPVSAGTFNLNALVAPAGSLLVNGASRNDIFNINVSGQTATINGGGGVNTLKGPVFANTWNVTATNAGTLDAIVFSNIQNLTGNSLDDTFNLSDGVGVAGIINGGIGGTNELNYSLYTTPVQVNLSVPNATNVGTILNINDFVGSGNPGDNLIGLNTPTTWVFTGADTGTLSGGTIIFADFANVTGGSASDIFDFTNPVGSISGQVDGGPGASNTILSPAIANVWTLTGNNRGDLNGNNFVRVQNLTGNTDTDDFVFMDGANITGTIEGVVGLANTFDYTLFSGPASVDLTAMTATGVATFFNIDTFLGNPAAQNTIKAPNTDNIWTTSALNTGTITNTFETGTQSFTDFENITGSAQDDTFFIVVGGISGTLDGGFRGINTLDYNTFPLGAQTDVNMATGTAPNLGIFRNINNIIGDSAFSAVNKLTGPTESSTWNFTGADEGTITNSVVTTFTFFTQMVGASEQDSFDLRSQLFAGTIDGGPGTNRVFGPNVPNNWPITADNAGEIAGVPFINIQSYLGGFNTDRFVFSDGVEVGGNVNGQGLEDINTLDYSAFTTPAQVVFFTESSGIASNIGDGFENIQSVIGNAEIRILPVRSLITNLQLSLRQVERFDYFDQFVPIRYVNYYSLVNEVLTLETVWPYIGQVKYRLSP